MNTSHYPSLELCRKLTEIGFPTTFQHIGDSGGTVIGCGEIPEGMYVSPSVMEMLDVMPKDYADTFVSSFKITIDMKNEAQGATVSVTKNGATIYKEFIGNFPNALAEMILWLHENNYISFNK